MALKLYTPRSQDSVFINCPFDDAYQPLLRAAVFCIYRCGFYPVTAMVEDNALDNRIDKLNNIIEKCQYGIHDISRTEVNEKGFPRFNMPFELGLFYGARRFGDQHQKNKNALIFGRRRYDYQQYISDINGVDIKAHANKPATVIRHIRNWLNIASRRKTIPGDLILISEFKTFMRRLPATATALGFESVDNIPFNDLCYIVEESIRASMGAD